MKENRSLYGPHNIGDYNPSPTDQLKQKLATDTTISMEYLEKLTSLVNRIEKLETFAILNDDRRKSYEEQRTADINALAEVSRGIKEVKGNIWQAGNNIADLLKEISELKEQGVDLTVSAKDIIQNAEASIQKKIEEYLEGDFVGRVDTHMNRLKNKVEAIEATHRQALDNLKHEYERSISMLESKQGKLLEQAIEEKNRIILPFESFWTMLCIFGLTIFCGFVCWIKFWRTSGNDDAMTYMVVASILEVIYYSMMAWNHFTDKERQKKKINNVFSVSLSEAVYTISLTFASIVYLVCSQLDVTGNTKLLIYLMPVVFASNFIWLFLRALAYGVFQDFA